MLSASVASVLKAFGSPEVAATAKLCEMVDNVFECLNVRSTEEHERKRKPFLAPYTSLDDRRYVNNALRTGADPGEGIHGLQLSLWEIVLHSFQYNISWNI